MYKINIRRLKGGEKKADQLETLRPEEQHSCEFSELFVCLVYLRFGAKEDSNLEMPTN